MSRVKKTVRWFVFFVGLAVAVGGAFLVSKLREPLPLHDGSASVPGLDSPVEILRDAWGVPHVYAREGHDLFFAQGYTQAQDRWWQMEFCRLASQGRLTELVGKSALATDVQVRALGLGKISKLEWQRYDVESASYLRAFADGVNAYLAERDPGELALEYSALRLAGQEPEIEPWSPIDSLTYARFFQFQLSANADFEQAFAQLQRDAGPTMVEDLFPSDTYNERWTILQEADYPYLAGSAGPHVPAPGARPSADDTVANQGHHPGLGSNGWTVSGRLTQNGRPMLAYDSHLSGTLPSPWYEIGLHCEPVSPDCPFAVSGFTFPLLPGVAVGHNQTVGWAFTASAADVQDYFELRVREDDPLSYEWNGTWKEMQTSREHFVLSDGEPLSLTMRVTHLGPIVNDHQAQGEGLPGKWSDSPLALRWVGLQPLPFFQTIFAVNRAQNWSEFEEALRGWRIGPLNFIYSDIYGNIGYQMTGDVPIRAADHSGVAPVPGWADDHDWQGMIPWDLLPHLLSPARGYIVNANQGVAPPSYWTFLRQQTGAAGNVQFQSVFPEDSYRAQRITELLSSERPHSVDTFQTMQLDNELLAARELLPALAGVPLESGELSDVRDWMLSWDGHMEDDSSQAAFFAFLWKALLRELYADNLANPAAIGSLPMLTTVHLLSEPANAWWDDVTTPDAIEGRDEILTRALTAAYAEAREVLGRNRNSWRWGDLHGVTFVSLLLGHSESGIVERLVNRGPYPLAGAVNCVNATGWEAAAEGKRRPGVDVLPVMRMVLVLGDWEDSVVINSTGQSGHVASGHYDDMIEPWLEGEYHPMLWERQRIEDAAVEQLILLPPTVDTECCEAEDGRQE